MWLLGLWPPRKRVAALDPAPSHKRPRVARDESDDSSPSSAMPFEEYAKQRGATESIEAVEALRRTPPAPRGGFRDVLKQALAAASGGHTTTRVVEKLASLKVLRSSAGGGAVCDTPRLRASPPTRVQPQARVPSQSLAPARLLPLLPPPAPVPRVEVDALSARYTQCVSMLHEQTVPIERERQERALFFANLFASGSAQPPHAMSPPAPLHLSSLPQLPPRAAFVLPPVAAVDASVQAFASDLVIQAQLDGKGSAVLQGPVSPPLPPQRISPSSSPGAAAAVAQVARHAAAAAAAAAAEAAETAAAIASVKAAISAEANGCVIDLVEDDDDDNDDEVVMEDEEGGGEVLAEGDMLVEAQEEEGKKVEEEEEVEVIDLLESEDEEEVAAEAARLAAEADERRALRAAAPPPPTHHLILGGNDSRLSDADIAALARVLHPRNAQHKVIPPPGYWPLEIIGRINTNTVSAEKLQCLADREWLNDDVVNFELKRCGRENDAAAAKNALPPGLGARFTPPPGAGAGAGAGTGGMGRPQKGARSRPFFSGLGAHGGPRRVWVADSFMLEKMTRGGVYDYSAVARWMRKAGVDIHEVDAIVFPVHTPVHWALCAIDLNWREVHYWDSMVSGGYSGAYGIALSAVIAWASDESASQKGEAHRISTDGWTRYVHSAKDVPQQMNGVDCGVFMLAMVRCLVAGRLWDFAQRDMPFLRRHIALGIAKSPPPA